MTRSRATAAAGLAALLLLAGCSTDSPEPAASPTDDAGVSAEASPSPEPSATSVVVAPERPAAMDDDGPAGAEAAATYFLQLDDYIMKTGDTAEWEAMSHKECEYCANRSDQAHDIAANDLSWSGGVPSASVTHTYEQDRSTGIWPIDVDVKASPVSVKNPAGEEVFSEPRSHAEFRVEIARKDGAWVVVGVAHKPES